MEKIELTSRISNTKEFTAKEYVLFCKSLIENLKNILPDIKYVYTFDNDKRYFFNEDCADMDTNNLSNIISYNEREDVFQNENPNDKELQELSTSWIGFNSLFYGVRDYSDQESLISIRISSLGAFEKDKFAVISLDFSSEYQSRLNFDIIQNIIELLSELVNLDYAVAYSDEFFDEIFKREYKLWIGWITFIKRPKIFSLLPNDMLVEKIDNGFLFTYDKNVIYSNNKVLVRKVILLRDKLGENGYLGYPFSS